VRSLVNIWGNLDRAGVQAWIMHMPAGPLRDEAQTHLESLPELLSLPQGRSQ
jgi:hypothetical protein